MDFSLFLHISFLLRLGISARVVTLTFVKSAIFVTTFLSTFCSISIAFHVSMTLMTLLALMSTVKSLLSHLTLNLTLLPRLLGCRILPYLPLCSLTEHLYFWLSFSLVLSSILMILGLNQWV